MKKSARIRRAVNVAFLLLFLFACPLQPGETKQYISFQSLERGYYLVQQVNSYSVSAFGAISTPSEANQVAEILKTHQVSGVEYGSLYYHQQDIAACISVADAFQKDGIDLWLSSGGLQAKIHAFNNDVFPTPE